jgi:hypothetical protein
MNRVNASPGSTFRPGEALTAGAALMQPRGACTSSALNGGCLPMPASSHRHRAMLGLVVTPQTVALLLAVLVVGGLIGLAVLTWLEGMR